MAAEIVDGRWQGLRRRRPTSASEPSVAAADRPSSRVTSAALDTVVACAGLAYPGATHEMPLAAWETMIRVNLTGTFLTVKHALPHLLDAGGGSIVTIGSIASLVAAGQSSAYDASKGGVLQFTRAIAVEYVDHGIRANCVCPGVVATGLGANSRAVTDHASVRASGRAPAERLDVPMSRRRRPGRDRRRRRLPLLRRRLLRHRRRAPGRRRLHGDLTDR